ncbi:TPA: PapB/FocB family fimbrial expression transcriptional regulator, partial [Salmonella enterica subsp. enterica serovar Virchow]
MGKNNTLSPGQVSDEQFCMLIDISPVRSDKVINALKAYFVNGITRGVICEKYNVNPGYLSIKIREIQSLSRKIVDIYPYYCQDSRHSQ